MNSKISSVLVFFLTVIAVSIFSCKHEIPGFIDPGTGTGTGSGTPTTTGNCSSDTVYFATEILPLVVSNCATTGCHDAITRKEGVQLTNYSTIMGYVKPFSAANSKLYKECIKSGSERMPPPPLPAFTQLQLSRIIIWINQGAKNNQCLSGCDSTLFTYSGAVSLTMNTYCKGCHNPASLGGGIDLSTYATVKASAAGRLLGSMVHTAGYSAMPKGSNKLSDCQISQIRKWIQAGTPNN